MSDTSEARWQRLRVLLEPFHEQAVATARRLSRSTADGDDLYHDSLLKAFEKLDTLRGESAFRSWFYAILLNAHRNRHRGSFWRRFLPMEGAALRAPAPARMSPASGTSTSTPAGRVRAAMALLKPEQREALVLFEIESFAIEEIAAMQHASIPAVKSRLVRGREALRAHYERAAASQSPGDDDALRLLAPLSESPARSRTTKEAHDA
jgi:RNA polymerase sigma-70 factor (ECF subfamily)